MSKKQQLMKVAISNLLKEAGKNIPEGKRPQMEKQVETDLAKKLGNNWTNLPFTGPYMLVSFIIFNYTLVPLGISPATITDTLINKTKELNLDDKSKKLLQNTKEGLKSSGEYSSERLDDIRDYLSSLKDHNLTGSLKKEFEVSKGFLKRRIDDGKSLLGSLGKKLKRGDSENDTSAN